MKNYLCGILLCALLPFAAAETSLNISGYVNYENYQQTNQQLMAALVVEVYGSDYASQLAAAAQISQVFAQADPVTDIDSSIEAAQPRWQLLVDQHKAALHGVSVAVVNQALAIALSGQNGSYLRSEQQYHLTRIELKL